MAERRNNRNNAGAHVATFRERGTFARAAPMAMTNGKQKVSEAQAEEVELLDAEEVPQSLLDKLSAYVFAGLPQHYPLRKKVKIAKLNFMIGISWDLIQLALAFLACAVYVITQYPLSLMETNGLFLTDVIITQFFMLDFFLNWYIHGTLFKFFTEWITIVDILTVIPVYFSLIDTRSSVLNVLRCLRILRLIRVLQGIKWVREMSGVQRQIMSLLITIVSIVFLATSAVQYVENDVHQFSYQCQYINRQTNFAPSCSPVMPLEAYLAESVTRSCDCAVHSCESRYNAGDTLHEPTAIRCPALLFFDSFYFIIVTMSSVGYGDISPTTALSQLVVVAFIFSSLILIPMQITELQNLIALKSPYRAPYVPRVAQEPHVILCGHVQNKRKLERFFQEFFHPDRAVKAAEELHAVILAPNEPSEEIRNLLFSHGYDARVTYVIGTALNVHDLKSVLADTAVGIFFLCNTEANEFAAHSEDASIVLRALSVSNFNPNLRCLVQVIRPEDSTILRDSEIGAISCLDEFKTSCLARNALCPGFACIIENLFHTMGGLTEAVEESLTPWYKEYMHGAGMESYFVPLSKMFLMAMNYNYKRIIEAIFVQFDTVVLGMTNSNGQTSLIFNPLEEELHEYTNFKTFFADFNVAVIIGDDQKQADDICKGLGESSVIKEIIEKLRTAEREFPCQKKLREKRPEEGTALTGAGAGAGIGAGTAVETGARMVPSEVVAAAVRPKGALRNFVSHVGIMRTVTGRINSGLTARGGLSRPSGVADVAAAGGVGRGDSSEGGASPVDSDNEPSSAAAQTAVDPPEAGGSPALAPATPLRGAARFKGLVGRVAKMKSAANMLQKIKAGAASKSPVVSPRTSDDGSSDEEEAYKSYNSDCSSVDTNDLSDDGFHYHTRDLVDGPGRDVYSDNEEDYIGYRATDMDIQQIQGQSQGQSGHKRKKKQQAIAKSANVHVPNSNAPVVANAMDALALQAAAPNGSLALGRNGARRGRGRDRQNSSDTNSEGGGRRTGSGEKKDKDANDKDKGSRRKDGKKKKPTQVNLNGRKLGRKSREIEEVSEKIVNHVIVTGCDANLLMFLSELRKPAVNGSSYHPIIVVSASKPSKWDIIRAKYNDIYLVIGTVTKMETFKRINVSAAFSFVLLASRDDVTVVDNESVDAKTLFAYLRLEQFIPKHVMFSVELTTTSNMTVLNATIMRREREAAEEEAKKELALNRMRRQIAGLALDGQEGESEAEAADGFSPGQSVASSGGGSGARHGGGMGPVVAVESPQPKREPSPAPMLGGGIRLPPPVTSPMGGGGGRGRRMSAFEAAGKFTNSHAKPGGGGGLGLGSASGGADGSALKGADKIGVPFSMAQVLHEAEETRVRDEACHSGSHSYSQDLVTGGFSGNDDDGFCAMNKRTTGRVSALTTATDAVRRKLEEAVNRKANIQSQSHSSIGSGSGKRSHGHSTGGGGAVSLANPRAPSQTGFLAFNPASVAGAAAVVSDRSSESESLTPPAPLVPNVRDNNDSRTPDRSRAGSVDREGLDRRDHSDSMSSLEGGITRLERVGSFMKNSISHMFGKTNETINTGNGSGANGNGRSDSFFKLPTMRADSMISKEVTESTVVAFNTYEQLFDATETHHVLPVFAAGQAFVPSCFETLLVQSFYIVLTPIICEKLVSGQLSQTVVQVAIPPALLTRKYVDVFRLFMSQRVLCIGLYRAAQKKFGALLPYVYLTPPGDTTLYPEDMLFCFGNAANIAKALKRLDLMVSHNPKLFEKKLLPPKKGRSMRGRMRSGGDEEKYVSGITAGTGTGGSSGTGGGSGGVVNSLNNSSNGVTPPSPDRSRLNW